MRWDRLPLPALILLAGLFGVIQLRKDSGNQAGYLLAASAILLSGVWVTLEVLRDRDRREDEKADRKKKKREEEP